VSKDEIRQFRRQFPSYQVLSFSKELPAIFPLIFARFPFVFQVINGDLRPGCRVIVRWITIFTGIKIFIIF